MKRWLRRIVIAAALIIAVFGVFFEAVTSVGRGRLAGEPFYDGWPASYWANEIERWETQDPPYRAIQNYARRPPWPRWTECILPEPVWPALLDGDRAALPVLQALLDHPSTDTRGWARIGIERLDNDERGPYKINPMEVIFMAQLYEVDEAFHKRLGNPKWLSMAELHKLEDAFLRGDKFPEYESLFGLLKHQNLLRSVKDVKIRDGKEGVLLSATKEIQFLPSPDDLRISLIRQSLRKPSEETQVLPNSEGQKGPQKVDEGVSLRAHVQIVRDRRFIRVKFIEKIAELEGIDKVSVLIDNAGSEADAEIACVKESTFSVPRTLPDGGSFLLPLQYRPADAKEKGRWFVVRIEARVYMEEEEWILQHGGNAPTP